MPAYAIGDIHGRLDELERLHALIAADRAGPGEARAPVVHIGDLCDRGRETRGVFAFILDGLARGAPWLVVKGNHEAMMSDLLEAEPGSDEEREARLRWLHPGNGGLETLASYGVGLHGAGPIAERARAAIPAAHRAFIRLLPSHIALDGLFFVHAGIRPGVPLDAQSEADMLWIRGPFLYDTSDHGALIVHGHTPVEEVTHYGNRVNLDTGAGYGRPASAVAIEGREVWELSDAGRRPVVPLAG
jgi:serine/threonine protein phosphatase 1